MILQPCGQKLSASKHTLKICHRILILLLHYLAKQTEVYVTTKPLRFYCINFQQTEPETENIYQKYLADCVSK